MSWTKCELPVPDVSHGYEHDVSHCGGEGDYPERGDGGPSRSLIALSFLLLHSSTLMPFVILDVVF